MKVSVKTSRLLTVSLSLCCLVVLGPSASRAQQLPYTTTWLGNNFGGTMYTTVGGWPGHKHVQLAVADMAVDSDGTVYTDSGWDEGGNESGIYRNGDIIGNCQELSHGWGRSGGSAVAFGTDYVYVAMHQNGDDGANASINSNGLRCYPDRGTDWLCVRRFHKNGSSAPFPTGYGTFNDMMILTRTTQVSGVYPHTDIAGMVVRGSSLYVSDPYQTRIAVYDTGQMSGTPTGVLTVSSPGKMTFDRSGRLWVLQDIASPKLICFDSTGHALPLQITFPPTMLPSAIAWDTPANCLLVADMGNDQNIKFYDPAHLSGAPARPVATLGAVGGIHSGVDGLAGPARFFDPAGVGADSSGNIYVASCLSVNTALEVETAGSAGGAASSGMSLESYKPSGAANWPSPLQCLEFVNCANVDPLSDTDIYSTTTHYAFDYSQPAGKGWKLKGVTLDRLKYPDDPRLQFARYGAFRGGVWVRHINGSKYLFMTEQMGHMICVERLSASAGETAVPYALISQNWISTRSTGWPEGQPGSAGSSTEWIWRDTNGNGKFDPGEYTTPAGNPSAKYDAGWGEWVDQAGDIWQSGHGHIRHFKMHLDTMGRPVWDYAPGDVELFNAPDLPNGATWLHGANADDDDMDRIEYEPATDTMYIAGFTTAYPDDTSGGWGSAGRVLLRYDHWSRGRSIHAGYPLQLPWDSKMLTSCRSLDIAAPYLFTVQGQNPETVSVYNLKTAALVGTVVPDDTVGKTSGWVDANYGLHAHKRANGEYIVFAEEDLFEKTIMYRWTPADR